MSHKHLVALVVQHNDSILVGKHAEGPFQGKWGVASIDSSVDRRPMRVALRLAETTCLGMLGTRNTLAVKKLAPSALGLQVYQLDTDISQLPDLLERTCQFLHSCFPATASVPAGLIPWQACKWVRGSSEVALDPISLDAMTTWQAKQSSKDKDVC